MSVIGEKSLQNALHAHEQATVQHFNALNTFSQHVTAMLCPALNLGGVAGQKTHFRSAGRCSQ